MSTRPNRRSRGRAARPLRPALRSLGLSLGLALALGAAAAATPPLAPLAPVPSLARIGIDGIGADRLTALEADPELHWWLELDRVLVVLAPPGALARLGRDFEVELLAEPPGSGPFVLVRDRRRDAGDDGFAEIARGGRWTLGRLRAEPEAPLPAWPVGGGELVPSERAPRGGHRFAFAPNRVLARAGSNLFPAGEEPEPLAVDPEIVDAVDVDRWFAAVSDLAAWNRWTRGTEIHEARDWLVARFGELPDFLVTTQQFTVPSPTTNAWNVLATLPGLGSGARRVIVGGHYDSTSESPAVAAPGAEDNASGCAGVLEMARILAVWRPAATVVFACYSGEEQGLYGGTAHAQSVVNEGLASSVVLMLNMDMIGYTGDSDLDVLVETGSTHAALLGRFQAAATAFTGLRVVTDTSPGGSDHVPFVNRGMPGVLTIENDYGSYPHYHRTTDLPGALTPVMAENILRMNVAVLVELAGVPLFADGFESGGKGQWPATTP
ncbi:MAG: M28 family peptidase [Thermoanaerobaculia bacterium]|nr:M28 family peptidase [Thermoanaerobaculia bacterium]